MSVLLAKDREEWESWAAAVVKGILFGASSDVTRETRNLVSGSALAIRNIVQSAPKLVTRLVG